MSGDFYDLGKLEIALAQREALIDALGGLVEIIDAAGLLQLSNGVELGRISWYVKASDRLQYARDTLSASHPPRDREAAP